MPDYQVFSDGKVVSFRNSFTNFDTIESPNIATCQTKIELTESFDNSDFTTQVLQHRLLAASSSTTFLAIRVGNYASKDLDISPSSLGGGGGRSLRPSYGQMFPRGV